MAAFNFFNIFAADLCNKIHTLMGTTDTFNILLTNTAPASTDTIRGNHTEVSNGNGYTTGGADTQNSGSRTTNVVTVTSTDVVWTASGSVGPFRYVILYNDTAGTTTGDPIIGWWDYGSSITLASGETFTVDFGASMLTVTVG